MMTELQKAERDAAFQKWCTVTIVDEAKAPKTARIVACWRSGWNAAWQSAFEAGRSAGDGCIEELLSDVQYLCDESHIPSAASRESVLRKAKTRVKKLKEQP